MTKVYMIEEHYYDPDANVKFTEVHGIFDDFEKATEHAYLLKKKSEVYYSGKVDSTFYVEGIELNSTSKHWDSVLCN
jgi:hypothetical protein